MICDLCLSASHKVLAFCHVDALFCLEKFYQFIQPFFIPVLFQGIQIFISVDVLDYNWDKSVFQTLPKKDKSSCPAVSISLCQVWDKKIFIFY
jgi:hypothetical protein